MPMKLFHKKGLTLLELSVTIVIVAVLFVVAFFYYKSAIERVRMSEIVTLMNAEVTAQLRNKATKGRYTLSWHQLDSQPVQVRNASANNRYANGLENTIYYTNGKETDGTPRSGFQIYFEDKGTNWFVVAQRVGHGTYTYTLIRPFYEGRTYCLPAAQNKKDQNVCMKFMGVETPENLPADPR